MPRLPLLLMVCAAFILAVSFGIRQSFGLFLGPMTAHFGWGHALFALAIATQNLVWGIGTPIMGAVADRFGIVPTLIGGTVCYAAGLLLMALGGSPGEFFLGAGVLVGIGVSGTALTLVIAAVARVAAPERRSFAIGTVMAGGSFGQVIMPLASQGLIDGGGWLFALLVLAALSATTAGFALALRPADRVVHEPGGQSLSAALREAAGHGGFWLLNGGFFVCGFHVAYISVHLPGYLRTLDFSPQLAAWSLAVIGLFNVIGSFVAGVLGGRFRMKGLLSLLYLARGMLFTAFLLATPSVPLVLLFSAGMGLLWLSTVPLTGGLVSQIFGPRYMATLFGFVTMSHQVGAFFGAWIGGWSFDHTGSYQIAWLACIALGVIAALLHLPIPDRPLRPEAATA